MTWEKEFIQKKVAQMAAHTKEEEAFGDRYLAYVRGEGPMEFPGFARSEVSWSAKPQTMETFSNEYRKAEYPRTPDECLDDRTVSVELIKLFRRKLRMFRNTCDRSLGKSRYLSIASTELEFAAMWLGDVLAVLGEKYPYEPGVLSEIADDTDEVVPFTGDPRPSVMIEGVRLELGRIQNTVLLWMTKPIGEIIPGFKSKDGEAFDSKAFTRISIAFTRIYERVREARLALGMEYRAALKEEQLRFPSV